MRVRVFRVLVVGIVVGTMMAVTVAMLFAPPATTSAAGPDGALSPSSAMIATAATATTVAEPRPPRPPVTANEFLSDERGLGECISSVPRPGCGSDARGGWHQTLVFLVVVAGLALITWRIVAGARKARREQTPSA